MKPEVWQRVKTIAADALEQETAKRAEFVHAQCADDTTVRREVEAILAESGDRVDRCADVMAIGETAEEKGLQGLRIGPYEVVREIGRGGMGAVYLARRVDGEYDQEVALKLLKRGTDTDEVLRRFRAERQILARLEHPNIARMLDGGTTQDGLPYFVMEYVHGVRITEFCSTQNLSIARRIELFLKVCAAVQFAHQNLVVHRDLKPGNILITPDGEPKLLDFGIAKLVTPEADFAQMTLPEQQRFTPAYASPEQVRGEPVTTVSDVYTLGALLYELLAGKPPHRFTAPHPSATELFRVIVESEPPRPSAAVEASEIRRQLRGDLDNILATALRKEPPRRYSGVAAFADDLRRYLENRPVRARAATYGYRASKFIARNRIGLAGAALLLLTLIGGIVSTSLQRARAERRFAEVRKLAHAVVFDYHDLVAGLRGSTPVRERLVRDALEYLDSLSREAGNDLTLLREVATAYQKVGQVQGNSYYSNLGDTDGAMNSYRTSLKIRQDLLAANPSNHELQDETAKSYEGLADTLYTINDLQGALAGYESARELRERAVAAVPDSTAYKLSLAEVYSKIGDVKGIEHYANLGDTAGALASCQKAQQLLEPLHAANPADPSLTSRLANVLTHVGMLLSTSGDAPGALATQRRAVAMVEQLAASNPDSQTYEIELLTAKHLLRYALDDNAQLPEAIDQSRRIIADLERLLASDPKNAQFRRNLGVTYNMLGRDLLLVGDVPAALESHHKALSISQELMAADARNAEVKADVSLSLQRLGEAQSALGEYGAALEAYREAIALREPTLARDPANTRAADDVASISAGIGKALAATGDFAGAADALATAVSLAEQISTAAPTNARLRARLALRYSDIGKMRMQMAQTSAAPPHEAQAEWQRARDYLARSVAIYHELKDKGTLIPADAARPDEVTRDLVECETALK